ncbi:TPA: MFS transporter, partial [Salmonella enterica subsp. enterica serovar Paratyphi A]
KKLSLKTSESERKMWNLVLPIICIFFLFVFMINNQLPVILKDLKMNEASLGLLISSSALGNILYGFYNLKLIKNTSIDSLKKLKNSTFSIMIIFILIGILINSSILSISYLMILFFVSGVFSSKFSIYLNIYLSTYMLENFGQIISKLQAIQNLIILFAPFLGAFILIKYNPSILFITCGVLGLVSMLILNILIKYSLFKNLNNVET